MCHATENDEETPDNSYRTVSAAAGTWESHLCCPPGWGKAFQLSCTLLTWLQGAGNWGWCSHTCLCCSLRALFLLSLHCVSLCGVDLLVLIGTQAPKLTDKLQNVQGKQKGQVLSPEGKPSSGVDLTHCASSH